MDFYTKAQLRVDLNLKPQTARSAAVKITRTPTHDQPQPPAISSARVIRNQANIEKDTRPRSPK